MEYEGRVDCEKWYFFRLINSSNVGLIGKTYNSISAKSCKSNQDIFYPIQLNSDNWKELGEGFYKIKLIFPEIDTYLIKISSSGTQTVNFIVSVRSQYIDDIVLTIGNVFSVLCNNQENILNKIGNSENGNIFDYLSNIRLYTEYLINHFGTPTNELICNDIREIDSKINILIDRGKI